MTSKKMMDDKCKKILERLEASDCTFKELSDKKDMSEPALSTHLKHLSDANLIINVNKKYQLHKTKKYSTTPFIIPHLEIHMNITKRDKKFEYLHYKIIRDVKNETSEPIRSISSYFGDEKIGKDWKDLRIDYRMKTKDNMTIPLYDSVKNIPSYFYENSPHMKKFKVEFRDYPLHKGETRRFIYERDWETLIENKKYTYAPDVYAENVEFYLTFPNNLDYELNVYEINKYTYEDKTFHKGKKENNVITWKGSHLSPQNYLEFRRELLNPS